MSREDVEEALRAMEDEGIRLELSQGDFSGVAHLGLTGQERILVRDAAGDYPEVARQGFDKFQGASDTAGGKEGGKGGGSSGTKGKLEIQENKDRLGNEDLRGFKWREAVAYLKYESTQPE